MSLGHTLLQTIAALDRIAPETEHTTPSYSDQEKEAIGVHLPYQASRDDEKFIRLSSSTLSSPYLRRSRSQPSLRSYRDLPEVDYSKMESHGDAEEPKLTLRYVAGVTKNVLTVAFSFLSIGVGIVIIGLAADNVNWSTGRGSAAANTVTAVVMGNFHENGPDTGYWDRWVTLMNYTPSYYDTPTFIGLIVAGAVAVVGGLIAAPLSVMQHRSLARPVQLGAKRTLSERWTFFVSLILEAFTFLTSVVVLICVRSLFTEHEGYTGYTYGDPWEIKPEYFNPPLRKVEQNVPRENMTWEPMDGVLRYYDSPMHYNPLNWNCRLQQHVASQQQHRFFQLCEEGNAARWLLVVLVSLQAFVLVSRSYDFLRRGRELPWTAQRSESQERIVSPTDSQ